MIQEYERLQPLYEAMSVGSYTVQWLQREEQKPSDFDLQFIVAKLNRAIEAFVERADSGNPLEEAPERDVQGIAFCVGVLNTLTRKVSADVRSLIPHISSEFQVPIRLLLDQTELLADHVEDILEAWQVSLDKDLSAKVESALAQVDPTKTDIPDWRETLELISD